MTKEISPKDIDITQIETFFPTVPDSSRLLVGTGREEFMATRLAQAVEDVDARLINMNVTSLVDDENLSIVAIRVDHRDPERVARSLERYGYNILSMAVSDSSDDTTINRYRELMHYLSI